MKFISVFCLLLTLLSGCSTSDSHENTPEGLFKKAQELDKDERYEEALGKYEELKNRFPYSKLSTEAELKMADIYFKREEFSVAATAYSNFRELHPNHSSIPYVMFQIGNSYFNSLPSTIDRDISGAKNAIKEFEALVIKHPNYEKISEAKEKTEKSYEMLAEKELYVADFYFKKEQYVSSLKRYESLLKLRASDRIRRLAYLGAGNSALEAGERSRAKEYLNTLIDNFPNTGEAEKAKSVLGNSGLLGL